MPSHDFCVTAGMLYQLNYESELKLDQVLVIMSSNLLLTLRNTIFYLDCKDSDAYASQCPTLAGYKDYCKYHHEWTKKYCAKSCGWCCKYSSWVK